MAGYPSAAAPVPVEVAALTSIHSGHRAVSSAGDRLPRIGMLPPQLDRKEAWMMTELEDHLLHPRAPSTARPRGLYRRLPRNGNLDNPPLPKALRGARAARSQYRSLPPLRTLRGPLHNDQAWTTVAALQACASDLDMDEAKCCESLQITLPV